jgi:hypothetical protein
VKQVVGGEGEKTCMYITLWFCMDIFHLLVPSLNCRGEILNFLDNLSSSGDIAFRWLC